MSYVLAHSATHRISQAHAVSGHKSQGQTLPQIVLSHLYTRGKDGSEYCLLKDWGWFYTAASRTKTRTGLKLAMKQLPLKHIQKRRHDVLAEVARLQVLHTRTLKLVHGTERTAVADDRRIASAVVALAKAKQAWVDALHRRR